QPFAGGPGGDGFGDAGYDAFHLPVDDDRVQALLAPEVLVHDRLGDLGPLRDLLHVRGLVPALGEDATADLDQLSSSGRRREATGTFVRTHGVDNDTTRA